MLVDRDHPVVSLPRGLCRTHADTGRVVAVVAEDQHVASPEGCGERVRVLNSEDTLERLLPHPFHFVPAFGNGGDVVREVAGVDAGPAAMDVEAPAHIDRHGEPSASGLLGRAPDRGPHRRGHSGAAGHAQEEAAVVAHGTDPRAVAGGGAT
jgi:hypothetical protein